MFVSCDLNALESVIEIQKPVAFYDPLSWYWKEITPYMIKADLYMAQNFFGVVNKLSKHDFKQLKIVPPIV